MMLRGLPRVFVEGALPEGPIELPKEELDKLRKVLRLPLGVKIAVLPNDGTLIECKLQAHHADPIAVHQPNTEPSLKLTLVQALPKGDKLDEIIRACTEIGVSHFALFPSDRTVVRWDEQKTADRVHRLQIISREAAEVSFRTKLPTFSVHSNFKSVLQAFPEAIVLSESERAVSRLQTDAAEAAIVVGPEGGWSKPEMILISDRGVTLGPRVLRVDHAGPAAAAILLLAGSGA